jgi:hypothetical protein
LENLAVQFQTLPFKERVWALIDGYKAELPPEAEQDERTKLWRFRLHQMDTRNFVQVGETGDGHILLQASAPESDIQQLLEEHKPRSKAFESAVSLLNWGQSVLSTKTVGEDWQDQFIAAKQQLAAEDEKLDRIGRSMSRAGQAYVAAICIRDHWSEISSGDQEWCATTIFTAVEADADTRDHFAIAGRNPMEASRPAAFILTALFSRELSVHLQPRLLSALAKSVLHAVDETVDYAAKGIGCFLWETDRSLALTCVQALVTQAVREHIFRISRERLPLEEFQPEFEENTLERIRSELRNFIEQRGDCDEAGLVHLDLTEWPGRAVARHVFTIIREQSDDLFAIEIIRHSVLALCAKWANNARTDNRMDSLREEERLDPGIESLFVETICRFVIRIEPGKAKRLMEPIFGIACRFPKKAADVVKWLILGLGEDTAQSETLWDLWQRFADDFTASELPIGVDNEYSDARKLMRELFLGINWGAQRDWPPLRGQAHRITSFFERLLPTECGFEFYSYFLAKAGSKSLPGGLLSIASKLSTVSGSQILNETAVFYLEQILTQLIYGGNRGIRVEPELRSSALTILDHLVAAGSSAAYKLREDFLTPFAH